MSITFVIRRLIFLVFVIWAAATITFFIPRISNRNPVRQRLAQLATTGPVMTPSATRSATGSVITSE